MIILLGLLAFVAAFICLTCLIESVYKTAIISGIIFCLSIAVIIHSMVTPWKYDRVIKTKARLVNGTAVISYPDENNKVIIKNVSEVFRKNIEDGQVVIVKLPNHWQGLINYKDSIYMEPIYELGE